jgi:hypothetical protein
MVVVPPPFEAVDKPASSSDTEHIVRYPILLTVELRASLLLLQDASHKSIPQIHSYRAPTTPDSLGRIKSVYSSCSTS